ncbi:hypothetical protein B566_EDAN002368 [Ephemera danica]|nr:hypothetical protein B566_EDAN002368 [Ephemera danica]
MALIEGMPGELDIFERPVLQTGIIGGNWYQYKPTAVVTDAAQLEFRIPGQGDHYVDLSRSLFNVKIKLVKADNAPYTATDVIAPVNNLLDTMFSDVKVEFNQKQVSDSRNMYHYRAYLEDLFNFNNTSKETHQTASLWFQDEAARVGLLWHHTDFHEAFSYKTLTCVDEKHCANAFRRLTFPLAAVSVSKKQWENSASYTRGNELKKKEKQGASYRAAAMFVDLTIFQQSLRWKLWCTSDEEAAREKVKTKGQIGWLEQRRRHVNVATHPESKSVVLNKGQINRLRLVLRLTCAYDARSH